GKREGNESNRRSPDSCECGSRCSEKMEVRPGQWRHHGDPGVQVRPEQLAHARRNSGARFMSITKQLYVRFGAILLTVLILLAVILVAVERERSAKAAASQALDMKTLTDQIRFQMMQNRLYLGNYLLSGDSREVDHMNEGVRQFSEYLAKNEAGWASDLARPMLEKRREVDAGNATVADLQIYYLQKDPSSWLKTSTD